MHDRLTFLDELKDRLIKFNGNDLVNKKLTPGATGSVFNIINEVPTFVVDELLGGKKFVLDPLEDEMDYLKDENDLFFKSALSELLAEEKVEKSDLSEEELRELKNMARERTKLPPPEEIILKINYDLDTGVSTNNHTDNKIQTDIPNEKFSAFLKKVNKSIINYKREKGIDSCYLAVGFLKWQREKNGVEREYNSPIFLVPLDIEEESNNKFSVKTSGKDYGTNRILMPIFKQEAGAEFPQYVNEDEDKSGIHDYLATVDKALQKLGRKGWEFQHRMAIGHFKSTGIPLEELDPKGYPEESIDNLYKLVGSDKRKEKTPVYNIDEYGITSPVPYTLIKADSSQYSSVVDVANGKSLVIEGPPGTGKSQTIVNILANAIHRDKKVLFLAQKTAALNVVYNRMQEAGLGNKCLPLHSEYASRVELFETASKLINETKVQSDLFQNLEKEFEKQYEKYEKYRRVLNKYCLFLEYKVENTELSTQHIITRYATLKNVPRPGTDLQVSAILTSNDIETTLESAENIDQLVERVGKQALTEIGMLQTTKSLNPFDADDFFTNITDLKSYLEKYRGTHSFRTLAEQKKHLEKKRKELRLAREIREKNKHMDENYVRAEIPERKELSELKTLMAEANIFARFFLPKFYKTRKRIRSMAVAEVKGHSNMIGTLSKIEKLLDEVSKLESEFSDMCEENTTVEKLESEIHHYSEEFKEACEKIDSIGNLCGSDCTKMDLDEIRNQISLILQYRQGINIIIEANRITKDLNSLFSNAYGFIKTAIKNEIAVRPAFESAIFQSLARSLSKEFPGYQNYDGGFIENHRRILAETTNKLEKAYRNMLKSKPPEGDMSGNKARKVRDKEGITLLDHICAKRNARVTVRELVSRSGKALQAFAPCFLMTPSSVADFLPKDFKFDLVVIDEASQMLVEESAGSMLRSKQYVVVGDDKQMPPTNYMVTGIGVEDELETKNESILERTRQSFDLQRRLLYHYRSKHETLIQFSNAEFYDNELMVIPSQRIKSESLGIQHIEVEGLYNPSNRGNSANPNEIEAERVVKDICEFMHNPANKECSLGVATLNLRQSQRIDDLMLKKLLEDPDVRDYVAHWKDSQEYFFIKNLENVQGDERDVIMIATVFGKDINGEVRQNFGPINKDQGEKRINVLVTRAKKQLRVYTSLKPNDITSQTKGAQVLNRYLIFSKTGQLENAPPVDPTGTFDSPWEKWFYDRLKADGYDVTSQVGVSKWRIDLGIKHSSYPYGYLCGIELDGAAYHSSSYARERDYLRQSILESQGWKIIRVWSTDFFTDEEGVYKRVKQDIERIKNEKTKDILLEN